MSEKQINCYDYKTSSVDKTAMPVSLDQLRPFFEQVTIGISALDQSGNILYANQAELQLLGYSETEYVHHNISEFYLNVDDVAFVIQHLANQTPFHNLDTTLLCRDKAIRYVLNSSAGIIHIANELATIRLTRDINRLKQSERHLKFLNKASAELSSMHDSAEALNKITAFIVPEFADWVVINELREDGFAHLLKMAHADPAKVKWAEEYRRTHPVDYNDPQAGSAGWVMRTGQPVLVSEITDEIIARGAKDDEQRAVLMQLSIQSVMMIPMQVKARVTGMISFMSCRRGQYYNEEDFAFAKDLTNHIALTLDNARLYAAVKHEIEERIAADKTKDEFISIASHELKTPITTLKAYTQLLQMNFENGLHAKSGEMLEHMSRQIGKLERLVIDLLDITKIAAGEIEFQFETFDFNQLVRETAEEMQRTTVTHKINLSLNPCDSVFGDRNRLGQVITNFISNAVKYSPKATEIQVSSECADNMVTLSVSDFGIGIPKEQQDQIFKRFFRATHGNSHSFPGLGLGLYICSEIIRRHHGNIFFSSEIDKGSTFSFRLPQKPGS